MKPATLTKILVIRNDKLGDFTLSLPTFAFLKHCLPSVSLHALVPEYTRPIAEICPYIDAVITDPGRSGSTHDIKQLRETLQQQHYTAALTLFSTTRMHKFFTITKYNNVVRNPSNLNLNITWTWLALWCPT